MALLDDGYVVEVLWLDILVSSVMMCDVAGSFSAEFSAADFAGDVTSTLFRILVT